MTYRCFPLGVLKANCYVLWEDPASALVIDPGAQPDFLLSQLKNLGVTVNAVLLTHVHFDHMMAAEAVLGAFHAPLLVPEADAPALTDPEKSLLSHMSRRHTFSRTADRLLRDGDTVTAGPLTLTVLHTPGHTPGSSCFLTESTLFSGDTLFEGTVGRTDFPGGNTLTLLQSLSRLLTLPDNTEVLPGHGEATTIGQEKSQNPFCRGEHHPWN